MEHVAIFREEIRKQIKVLQEALLFFLQNQLEDGWSAWVFIHNTLYAGTLQAVENDGVFEGAYHFYSEDGAINEHLLYLSNEEVYFTEAEAKANVEKDEEDETLQEKIDANAAEIVAIEAEIGELEALDLKKRQMEATSKNIIDPQVNASLKRLSALKARRTKLLRNISEIQARIAAHETSMQAARGRHRADQMGDGGASFGDWGPDDE